MSVEQQAVLRWMQRHLARDEFLSGNVPGAVVHQHVGSQPGGRQVARISIVQPVPSAAFLDDGDLDYALKNGPARELAREVASSLLHEATVVSTGMPLRNVLATPTEPVAAVVLPTWYSDPDPPVHAPTRRSAATDDDALVIYSGSAEYRLLLYPDVGPDGPARDVHLVVVVVAASSEHLRLSYSPLPQP